MIREFSAGGVVFKRVKEQEGKKVKALWLVTKQAALSDSIHPPDIWRLPKGWLDDAGERAPGPLASGGKKATEEELRYAALREVREEGGVEAKIVDKVATIRFFFTSTRGKILKFVTFYLMQYLRDLEGGPDFETEEVAWLPFSEARKRLSYSSEKQILDKAKELL